MIFLSRRCVAWMFWVRKSEDPSGRWVLDPVRPTWSRALQKNRQLVEIKPSGCCAACVHLNSPNRVLGVNVADAESTLGAFRRYSTGRNATVDSAGKTHCSSVASAIESAPPYRGASLVQSVFHLKPDGGASKGSPAGFKICRSPKFTMSRRSSFSSEKYLRTKLAGPRTAPSIPPELCSRNRESSRRNFRRSMCKL